MTQFILAFRDDSDTIAGERKLLDAGVDVQLIASPKAAGPACNICLKVNSADMGKVRMLLAHSIRSIFPVDGDGEEAAPCSL